MYFIVLFYRVGRRYMVCISTSLTFIANIAMPFSTSVFMFSVCRFFDGFCGNCLYMASFIIGKSIFFVKWLNTLLRRWQWWSRLICKTSLQKKWVGWRFVITLIQLYNTFTFGSYGVCRDKKPHYIRYLYPVSVLLRRVSSSLAWVLHSRLEMATIHTGSPYGHSFNILVVSLLFEKVYLSWTLTWAFWERKTL